MIMIIKTETLKYQDRTVRIGEIVTFASSELEDRNIYAEILNFYKYTGGIKIYACVLDTINKNYIGSYWYIDLNRVTFIPIKEQVGLKETIEVING